MSQIFKAIFATLAVSATFGAVQLASGHDLIGGRQVASTEPAGEINRGVKADRVVLKVAQNPTETITIRSVGLPDTSVVVRIPVAQAPAQPAAREAVRIRPESPAKPGVAKRVIACEPPVSVLTEVAKLLQPGRCVT
jgi:hypothetical protein